MSYRRIKESGDVVVVEMRSRLVPFGTSTMRASTPLEINESMVSLDSIPSFASPLPLSNGLERGSEAVQAFFFRRSRARAPRPRTAMLAGSGTGTKCSVMST